MLNPKFGRGVQDKTFPGLSTVRRKVVLATRRGRAEVRSALLIRSGRGKELLFELDLEWFFRAFGEYIDLKA